MVRFDKKWMFVHVPAGIAAVCLLAFGVHQCDSKGVLRAEHENATELLKKHNKAQLDSLNALTTELLQDRLENLDSIDALNDSVYVLNGRVVDLTNKNDSLVKANDSLVVALDDCAKSKKQKTVRVARKKTTAPAKKQVVHGAAVGAASADAVSARPTTEVRLGKDAVNDGNIIVGDANAIDAQVEQLEQRSCGGATQNSVVISMGDNSRNDGTIVVGNANTVYRVLPDTVVRFVKAKKNVIKCRAVSKQRQYR